MYIEQLHRQLISFYRSQGIPCDPASPRFHEELQLMMFGAIVTAHLQQKFDAVDVMIDEAARLIRASVALQPEQAAKVIDAVRSGALEPLQFEQESSGVTVTGGAMTEEEIAEVLGDDGP